CASLRTRATNPALPRACGAGRRSSRAVLVDKPFPDERPLERFYNDLLIGDVETVAEKLAAEIRATHPVHMCFSFKVGATPHKAAMRSMELMMSEVRPRVERAVGALTRNAAD